MTYPIKERKNVAVAVDPGRSHVLLILVGLTLTSTVHPLPAQPPIVPPTLEQMKAGTVKLSQALLLLDAGDPDFERTFPALRVLNPGWADEAILLVRSWIANPNWADDRERELTLVLQGFRDVPGVETLVAQTLADDTVALDVRRLLLHGIARMASIPPTAWLKGVEIALVSRDTSLRRDAVAVIRKHEISEFDVQLEAIVRQDKVALDLRVAAIDAMTARERPSNQGFALLMEHLDRNPDPVTRLTVARALGASQPTRKQLMGLAPRLTEVDPLAGLLLLPAFARNRDREVGLALVNALNKTRLKERMSSGDLERLLAFQGPEVQRSAGPLQEVLAARLRERRDRLGRLANELPPGNVQRGKDLFFSDRTACASCHRAAGQGGGVGPNLSRVSFLLRRSELLESVVLPNAYIVPEFRSLIVRTNQDQVFLGIPVLETSRAIYLRNVGRGLTRIKRDSIESISWSPVSLMPEGYENVLSKQELSDLLEFLAGLR